MYTEDVASKLLDSMTNILSDRTVVNTPREAVIFADIMNSIAAKKPEKPSGRYNYIGMDDFEVENMVIENLPESMTLENMKIYMSLYRAMHDIINSCNNMGGAVTKGSAKLGYILDYIENNPSDKLTIEAVLEGSSKIELYTAQTAGNYDSHLHDLARMEGDKDKNINDLLTYYLQVGDEYHMSKYFDLQGEAAAADVLKRVMDKLRA